MQNWYRAALDLFLADHPELEEQEAADPERLVSSGKPGSHQSEVIWADILPHTETGGD